MSSRGKTVLLPCDDHPEWSNFTKFFAQNFERFGLKKLSNASYAKDSKTHGNKHPPSLLKLGDLRLDKQKTKIKGPWSDSNKNKIWALNEMDADHVTAWSKGGSTDVGELADAL
jgi:hypothetical protein